MATLSVSRETQRPWVRALDSLRVFPLRSRMRLSSYPYVTVRVACSRCPRRGAYRLARLADRYGAEITLPYLIEALAADCKLRDHRRLNLYDRCGAHFPDVMSPKPPDEPAPASRPTLKVVR
ncbi:hypothetical protein RHAL1_00610 [Beijerinckiaceae bacterium RH AL1]|nr:hypothetical protein [Beijerinckiaceae bacterium]VVB43214.1 hypothetical protein RHAL8_00579 [Beijerinckiaceae bacterium RH AL8]VVB43229.1 hypothetical protein RHCH11_RHCH11_00581 [Beijerinckiaceae bacterium RH CH11]VVC53728.1 hypothetical protein RHAL1_00610 [Beijerinckiaceae bacterium RH AL1]